MKYGSCFTGIGGFDLGLDRVGMSCAWQVEKDKQCLAVLENHWPNVERHNDVKTFARGARESVDLICGGFPCQDLSVAGKRAGLAGKRSGLFHEFMRIVGDFTPRWIFIENVPGLLSSNKGLDMATVIGTLAKLGYGWAYRVLDSQYFGLAQRRKRVFIVGCFGDMRSAAKVLFESEGLPWDSAPRREERKGIAGTLESRTLAGGFPGTDGACSGHVIAETVREAVRTNSAIVANSLNAHSGRIDGESETFVATTLQASGGGVSSGHHPIVFDKRNITSKANRSTVAPGRECHTLHSSPPTIAYAIQEGADYENIENGPQGKGFREELAYTIEARHHQQAIAKTGVRRLTPIECARLQGFPDDWLSGQSDSAQYKMLGNAVSVPVIEWIGRRLTI